MARSKIDRLAAIKLIILQYKISCQDELLSHLSREGYNVTQATLSRDIKELKIAKMPDVNGKYFYSVQDPEKNVVKPTASHVKSYNYIEVNSIEFSGQVAVIKTEPGFASVVASVIDGMQTTDIMGTIAGDDTVLLIMREKSRKGRVLRELQEAMPDIKEVYKKVNIE